MIPTAYLIIFVIILALSYEKFRSPFNLVSVFTAIWFFFGAVSSLGLYKMRTPSLQVHAYVWLYVIVVDIVLLLFCRGANSLRKSVGNNSFKPIDIFQTGDYKTYSSVVQIIALLFYSPMMIKSIQTFISHGFVGIRSAYFSAEYEKAYLFSLLCKTMPGSLMYGLIVYYMYRAFETKRWSYFIYALINAVTLMLINGGRYSLMEVLFSAVVIIIIKHKPSKRGEKKERDFKNKIKQGIIMTAVAMIIVTILRQQAIAKSIVIYFSGSFSFLDYILKNPGTFGLTKYLFGYLTFGCITEPFVLALKVLGLTLAKTPSYLFNVVGQDYYNIGSEDVTILFNNNTTVLYYFLRDFGALGIVVGGIFLSSIIVYSYNRWMNGSKFYALLYIYTAVVLLNTIMTYQLFACGPFFSIIAMYFCSKPVKIRMVQ